jgi:hypothetical protein
MDTHTNAHQHACESNRMEPMNRNETFAFIVDDGEISSCFGMMHNERMACEVCACTGCSGVSIALAYTACVL